MVVVRQWVVLLACIAAGVAWAVDPEVRAFVDATTVPLRGTCRFTLEVTGAHIGTPEIPRVPRLNINRCANFTEATATLDRDANEIIKVQRFNYFLQPLEAGETTVPPVRVMVDGKVFTTDTIALTVTADPVTTVPPPSPSAPMSVPVLIWDDALFLEADLDKREAYQGESVLLTLRLWQLAGVDFRPSDNLRYPASEGFYAITLPPSVTLRERDGRQYEVQELRQMLYPTANGDLLVGAWTCRGKAVFGRQRADIARETAPMGVAVKPLPQRPPEFGGAVGRFAVSASVATEHAVQGTPLEFEVRVNGEGNPDAIGEPSVSAPEHAQMSGPEKNVRQSPTETGILVEKTFTYAITPYEAGDFVVPEVALCYFDPARQSYETVKTKPVTVRVGPSYESEELVVLDAQPPPDSAVTRILAEDLAPIVRATGPLRPASDPWAANLPAAVLPPALYGGFVLWLRRKRRFDADAGYARAYHARTKGLKRLAGVADAPEPAEALFHVLTGYVADKFDVPTPGLTSGDAARLLESNGAPADLAANVARVLRACERARYAAVRLSDAEIAALTSAAAQSISQLEAILTRRVHR